MIRSIICSYLAHFLIPSSKNNKNVLEKVPPKKVLVFSYITGNGTFLYFLKRKLFIYFGKQKLRKNSLHIRNETFLYFKTESNFHISGSKFSSLKIFLFWEVELSSPKLKKNFIFQEGT